MDIKQNKLLRLGSAAAYLYGENTAATRQRLTRLAQAGDIRCVRLGQRRDRWFPTDELDRLFESLS